MVAEDLAAAGQREAGERESLLVEPEVAAEAADQVGSVQSQPVVVAGYLAPRAQRRFRQRQGLARRPPRPVQQREVAAAGERVRVVVPPQFHRYAQGIRRQRQRLVVLLLSLERDGQGARGLEDLLVVLLLLLLGPRLVLQLHEYPPVYLVLLRRNPVPRQQFLLLGLFLGFFLGIVTRPTAHLLQQSIALSCDVAQPLLGLAHLLQHEIFVRLELPQQPRLLNLPQVQLLFGLGLLELLAGHGDGHHAEVLLLAGGAVS